MHKSPTVVRKPTTTIPNIPTTTTTPPRQRGKQQPRHVQWWSYVRQLFRGRRGMIGVLVSLALFVDMWAYGAMVPILPGHLRDVMGKNEQDIAVATQIYAVGLLATTPAAAFVSDTFGSRRIPLLLGHAMLVASCLVFVFSSTYEHILIARFLQGISAASTWTVGLSLTVDTFNPSMIGTVLGIQAGCNFLGSTVGGVVSGALYEWSNQDVGREPKNLRAVFIPCAVLATSLFIFRFVLKDPKKWTPQIEEELLHAGDPSPPLRSQRQWPPIDHGLNHKTDSTKIVRKNQSHPKTLYSRERLLSGASMLSTASSGAKDLCKFWLRVIYNGRLILCASTVVVCMGVMAALEPIIPLYLEDRFGATEALVGVIFSFVTFPGIVVPPLAGRLSDKFGPRLILVAGLLMQIVSLPLLTVIPTQADKTREVDISAEGSGGEEDANIWWFAPVFGLLGTASYGVILTPVLPELSKCIQVYSEDVTAQAYAIFNIAWAIGLLWGPAVGSFLYRSLQLPTTTHILNGLVQLILVTMMVRYVIERRRARNVREENMPI